MCDRIQIEAHIYSLHCDIKSGLVKKKIQSKATFFPDACHLGRAAAAAAATCVYIFCPILYMNERARAYNENKVVGASRRGFFYVSTCATGKSGNCELYIYFRETETDESHVRERVAEFIIHIP